MVGLPEIRDYVRVQAEADAARPTVHAQGATLEAALEQASIELGLPIRKISYELLDKGSRGFFGVGSRPTLLLAYPTPTDTSEDDDEAGPLDFEFKEERVDRDGGVFVRLTPAGVMLKVTPPEGGGKAVSDRDALRGVSERFDGEVNNNLIAKVARRADGEFVVVGEFPYQPDRDAQLRVDITEGEMKAVVTAQHPGYGGADPDFDTYVGYLRSRGVVEGILEDVLQKLHDSPVYGEPVVVAEGRRPKNGADAKVVYHFERGAKGVKLKEVDGKVDFKELNLLQNVVEGQVLARKTPAERGEAGRTVTGKLLPAEDGRDVDIPIGKNVRLSEDRRQAVAAISGQVILDDKINVEPILVLNEVSIETGNQFFLGTIIVKGNVESGYSVKAAGNIEVQGTVGRAEVDAEHDVIVHQGVNGSGGGSIRAGGDVLSKFIANARVEAGGSVLVSGEIQHCDVIANNKVICRGKKARIAGGSVRAREAIQATILGSPNELETILEVGNDPKSSERLLELAEEISTLQPKLEEVALEINYFENELRARKKLSTERRVQYDDRRKLQKEMKQREADLTAERAELLEYVKSVGVEGRVSASAHVHAGVRVIIREAEHKVRHDHNRVTFVVDGDQVKIDKFRDEEEDTDIRKRGGYGDPTG